MDSFGTASTAVALRSMFKNELSEEVIARQKKVKLTSIERRRIEVLMIERLSLLEKFLCGKVAPRMEMFVELLNNKNSTSTADIELQLNENKNKIASLEAKEEEEKKLLEAEIERKYAEKRRKLAEEQTITQDALKRVVYENERKAKKLKVKLDEKLHQFKGLTFEMRQMLIERLWTQATTLFDGQSLLNSIPDTSSFLGVLENLAITGGDTLVKCLLAGKVEEKTDWYCSYCHAYDTIQEGIHDGNDGRPSGKIDYDAEKHKGERTFFCTCCKKEYIGEKAVNAFDSRFQFKTREVISIDGSTIDVALTEMSKI